MHANFYATWFNLYDFSKTEISTFHRDNKLADYKPSFTFSRPNVNYNSNAKYLRITLDVGLAFKTHLANVVVVKISTRNNIIEKPAGSERGADHFSTLRTSTRILCDGIVRVWVNSAHVKRTDSQISRTVKSTPVLSNIAPPALHSKHSPQKL